MNYTSTSQSLDAALFKLQHSYRYVVQSQESNMKEKLSEDETLKNPSKIVKSLSLC